MIARVEQMVRFGTPLAYFTRGKTTVQRADDFSYHREVLTGSIRSKLTSIQSLVPAGEPLGAWVMTPFLFDFKRNPIFQTEPAGLSMRWAQLPSQVHYFLLEYRGFAVRTREDLHALQTAPALGLRRVGSHSGAFLAELIRRSPQTAILYNDGDYVLVQLEKP